MSINWKKTLLMPQTKFPMKAQLVQKEPEFREKWNQQNIYQKALEANKKEGKGTFVLHDGPPYANGNIHVGHALNKILKDIIVRNKIMEGYYAPYIPGWDTHGLPIENKMLQEMNATKDDFEPFVLRKKASAYAKKQITQQKKQFQKLQLFADFKNIYSTLMPEFEAEQLTLFKKMILQGLIYKGLKPIYWSPSSQSALAEAEVEYQNVKSPQIIVAFSLTKVTKDIPQNTSILIMTTTPWTLVANSGVAIGENLEYLLVEIENEKFILEKNTLQNITELCKWKNVEILKKFKGSTLINFQYESPINKLECPIVSGHHVEEGVGTGLVHMAPLFGEEDYIVGKKHNLQMIMHIDAKGFLNKEGLKYSGNFYQDANKLIGKDLLDAKKLLSLKFVSHSYPHDWRTHKPVIYRGVPQWFVKIKPLQKQLLKTLSKIKSTPTWGIQHLSKMVQTRNEWTISRQRTWGVPLIIFYDENKQPVIQEDIFNHVIELVRKHGSNIWWEKSTRELLPKNYQGKNWTRESDIMDVWFDSGSSFLIMQHYFGLNPPFDLYLEGGDQYRGWFNSSLINSVAINKEAPFKNLLSHGFVLNAKQEKMSKSKGNVIDPLEVIKKYGAEILRLWAANSEFTSNISISDSILQQNVEIYRRIRNSIKFMLGNIFDFDILKHEVKTRKMHKYIRNLRQNFEYKINELYSKYKFQEVIQETNKFLIDLSGWYFDCAKDVLYCDAANSFERRSIQTNIFYILQALLFALAPILPTTIEEAYSHIPNFQKIESVFLIRKKEVFERSSLDSAAVNFYTKYRIEANKVLEVAREKELIKRNNEAHLIVNIPLEDRIFTNENLVKYFMVGKVSFGKEFAVKTFASNKCPRCWNHLPKSDLNNESLCSRCQKVLT